MNEKEQVKDILLIEDDMIDVMTVKRSLRDLESNVNLHTAGNGEEALEYLTNEANTRPNLILLDINMPRMNGLEFLEVAKKDPEIMTIPVVVLTTSKEVKDRFQSYSSGIAGYMVKPVDYGQFVEVMSVIQNYWQHCELV